MRPTQLVIGLSGGLLLASCANEENKRTDEGRQIPVSRRIIRFKGKRTSPELDFLRAKKYRYVTRVAAIPTGALAAITDNAQLCDEASGIPINLTDVHINYNGQKECTRKLNFALVGDTCCFIVYRQGGIGVHDVMCFIHYRGKYSFTKNVDYEIDDTIRLAHFLQKQPATEQGYSDKITPPPPWPTKAVK